MSKNQTVRLLGISGSLRRDSHCSAVLATIQAALTENVVIDTFSLSAIPLYNQDDEQDGVPQPVAHLRGAIAAADGLVLISPEYNHGMPGVLKNAIDWASRPSYESALKDKPVLCITASPGQYGGVRAHADLHKTLGSTLAVMVRGAQIAIPAIASKISDGRLVDPTALDFVMQGVDRLVRGIVDRRNSEDLYEVAVDVVEPQPVPEE